MSRPEYLNCIMTPGVIRGIRERQERYDEDPAAFEREETRRNEERIREEEEQRRQWEEFHDQG